MFYHRDRWQHWQSSHSQIRYTALKSTVFCCIVPHHLLNLYWKVSIYNTFHLALGLATWVPSTAPSWHIVTAGFSEKKYVRPVVINVSPRNTGSVVARWCHHCSIYLFISFEAVGKQVNVKLYKHTKSYLTLFNVSYNLMWRLVLSLCCGCIESNSKFWLFSAKVHPCGPIFLLSSWGLWPSPGRWKGGLVWFSSVCAACHVENDAQYWWWETYWILCSFCLKTRMNLVVKVITNYKTFYCHSRIEKNDVNLTSYLYLTLAHDKMNDFIFKEHRHRSHRSLVNLNHIY